MKSLILIAAVAALMSSPVRADEQVTCKSYTDFWSVDGGPTKTCYTVGAWPDDEQYITPNKPAHEQHTNGQPAAPAAPCPGKGK